MSAESAGEDTSLSASQRWGSAGEDQTAGRSKPLEAVALRGWCLGWDCRPEQRMLGLFLQLGLPHSMAAANWSDFLQGSLRLEELPFQ